MELEYFLNLDLESVVTPIRIEKYEQLLRDTKYPAEDWDFLVRGFKEGFDIGYDGPAVQQNRAENIPFTIGNEAELWNKIMKEVKLGRYAGPFKNIPYQNFIQSPIGIVPKGGGKKTRLIFHLSFDFDKEGQDSLNYHTPNELCSVKYMDLDYAVKLSLDLQTQENGQGIFYGKTNLTSAFRILGLNPACFNLLIMKTQDPRNGKWWFFVDKCLPFGSSRSCALFQKFSDSLAFLVEQLANRRHSVSNYLDDFLFIPATLQACEDLINTFLQMCSEINCPVAEEKTVCATQLMVFLGVLMDGKNFLLALPEEKCKKAMNLLQWFISKKCATIKQLQKLTGTLNFLMKAIFVGRVFTRRMYAKYANIKSRSTGKLLKHYHHVKLDTEFKSDCLVWLKFLENAEENRQMMCRSYVDLLSFDSSQDIVFFLDAFKNERLGFGVYYDKQWTFGAWELGYIKKFNPSIEYLELFALCVGIFTWAEKLKDCRITIFCDNQAVVSMVNNMTSGCQNCMVLLRLLVLNGLTFNRRILVKYIPTKKNNLADALSHLRLDLFWRCTPSGTRKYPERIPPTLWPLSKLWKH